MPNIRTNDVDWSNSLQNDRMKGILLTCKFMKLLSTFEAVGNAKVSLAHLP